MAGAAAASYCVITCGMQGLLSEAVQWPVLQEQLLSSRQGCGELWQFFTAHVRTDKIVCVGGGVSARACENFPFLLSRFLLFT